MSKPTLYVWKNTALMCSCWKKFQLEFRLRRTFPNLRLFIGKSWRTLMMIYIFYDQLSFNRYSVMAGTPEKMLEYLLETRIDCEKDESIPDTFMDDFLLTHLAFGMPTNVLCNALSLYYHQSCSVSAFKAFYNCCEFARLQFLFVASS